MPRLAHRAQDRAERADPGLTRAQSAVLGLVGQGFTTARIAAQLGMSPATVEAHIRGAKERLGARSRLQAAAAVPLGSDPSLDTNDRTMLSLHPEEQRLLRLLAAGATLCEAAAALHVSRRTCARRLASAKAKLGAGSTVEAVLLAVSTKVPKVLVAIVAVADVFEDAFELVFGPLGLARGVPL
jgi:DNA-binding CsgD family transcriptional regulator